MITIKPEHFLEPHSERDKVGRTSLTLLVAHFTNSNAKKKGQPDPWEWVSNPFPIEWMACKKAVVLCRFVPDVRNLPLSAPHLMSSLPFSSMHLFFVERRVAVDLHKVDDQTLSSGESHGEDIGCGAIVFGDRRDLDGSLQIVTQCVTNAQTVDVKTTDPHRSTGSTDQSIG